MMRRRTQQAFVNDKSTRDRVWEYSREVMCCQDTPGRIGNRLLLSKDQPPFSTFRASRSASRLPNIWPKPSMDTLSPAVLA